MPGRMRKSKREREWLPAKRIEQSSKVSKKGALLLKRRPFIIDSRSCGTNKKHEN